MPTLGMAKMIVLIGTVCFHRTAGGNWFAANGRLPPGDDDTLLIGMGESPTSALRDLHAQWKAIQCQP